MAPHQFSSDQANILKDQSAQTTNYCEGRRRHIFLAATILIPKKNAQINKTKEHDIVCTNTQPEETI